jgi:molybdopterin-guanine dinucleotide biosynthesis protein A
MLGVILSGGASSRMGKDKGLVKTGDQYWASLAAEKISSLAIPVVISVNRFQLPVYLREFKDNKLIPDDETLKVRGPLSGILSVHNKNKRDDLLVLACDMPLMESFILQQLQNAYKEDPGYQAYVYASDEGLEPLVGIYSHNALRKIIESVKAGKLKKFSMHSVLESLKVFRIEIPQENRQYFQNFNNPKDLARPLKSMNKPKT